jgi:hypothetical protein
MVGQRTRAALEREKLLALRAIKELEFDRAMGKLSESDWQRCQPAAGTAARLMRQLDAGAGYMTDRTGTGERSGPLRQRPLFRKKPRVLRRVRNGA